jgi:poly-gamma-glutamate capsule biosynthesis protein CapA/YwtB (metallophosphatase superfamily)
MKEYLKQHITIANLEGPIPDSHTPTPINGFSFSFPATTPRTLREGGITAVTLANNHMFDQGRNGYEETQSALRAGGVDYFGGYVPTEEDYFETKLGTTTVIVYGITMIATGWEEAQALDVTKELRREHEGAHLIAFVHWGDEYKTQNIYQRTFAHALIDNGVDAIIGSHPHVVQGIELYKGKPIFYSLGNFIFDQYWQSNLEDGLAVKLKKEGTSYVYELVPVHSTRSVPSIATSIQREKILKAVSTQSPLELRPAILEGNILVQ